MYVPWKVREQTGELLNGPKRKGTCNRSNKGQTGRPQSSVHVMTTFGSKKLFQFKGMILESLVPYKMGEDILKSLNIETHKNVINRLMR